MEDVGHYQSCRTQGSVARGYGGGNNAKHGNHGQDGGEPLVGYYAHHGVAALSGAELGFVVEEIGGCGGPYQGHNALGYHGSVEDGTCLFFVNHAACHQRRLRGVESRDGSAGYAHEHHRENGVGVGFGVLVGKAFPHFGEVHFGTEQEGAHHKHRHQQQQYAENGVDASYQLVDGEHGGKHVIHEDYHRPNPYLPAGRKVVDKQLGGCLNEHSSHQNHQYYSEIAHKLLGAVAEVSAVELGQGAAVVAERHKSGDEVVHRTGEDAAENYPQERRRAELRTHDGSHYWAHAGDVEELDKENAPGFHRHIVHAVGHGGGGSGFGWVRAQNLFYYLGINEISQQKQNY